MKTNTRPFIREYKSHSLKMAPQAPQDFAISGPVHLPMGRRETRSATEQIATQSNRSVQEAADALFIKGEASPATYVPEGEMRDIPQPRGRILPCSATGGSFSGFRERREGEELASQQGRVVAPSAQEASADSIP
jgi:hypothetical protein